MYTTQLLDVVTTAGVLYIVAVGLLVVYGVLKIINLAHGAFLAMGAYAGVLTTWAGWNPWTALLLAAVMGVAVAALVEWRVLRALYARPLDTILATWGLNIIVVQILTLYFGREIHFAESAIAQPISVAGVTYSQYRLVRFVTFCLGAGLASLAGALLTPLVSVHPNLGVPWLINAFMLVLVAGVSLGNLALAALVLGGAQVLVSSYGNPVLGSLTIVILAVIILRFRTITI